MIYKRISYWSSQGGGRRMWEIYWHQHANYAKKQLSNSVMKMEPALLRVKTKKFKSEHLRNSYLLFSP